MRLLTLAVFVLSCVITAQAANILAIFSFPAYSHQHFHNKVLKILADEGHSLTIFTSHPHDYGDNPNVTQHLFTESEEIHNNHVDIVGFKKSRTSYAKRMLYHEAWAHFISVSKEMKHPEIQKMISNSSNYKFDLLIIECYICSFLVLAEIHDCPIAILSAAEISNMGHEFFGNDANPLKFSEMFMPYVYGKLSFLEKLDSIVFKIFQEFIFKFVVMILTGIINFNNFSHLGMVAFKPPSNRLSLLMTNTNQALGYVRPMMPHSIQIGFVHVEKPKEIKELDIKRFLDLSTNGVIMMNFGSIANTKKLGTDVVNKFISAFKMTNMNVLWKIDGIEDMDKIPNNVKIVASMPLADVLAHKNVKLLILHGGLCSIYEAIDRGVPMIAFPLASDHSFNVRNIVEKGIGMKLDLNNFDEFELNAAIQEMIKPKYVTNIRRIRSLAYDQLNSNRDLIVWHVNNAIKNRIAYAKDFGSLSYFGTPYNQGLIYLIILIGLLYLIFKKKKVRNVKEKLN